MASSQYLNMLEPTRLFVFPDFKTWGGISPSPFVPLSDARVNRLTLNQGATFDSAELIFSSRIFGEFTPFFFPIRIIFINDIGTQKVLFRGFINSDTHTLSSQKNEVVVTAIGYKWLYSRRTLIRGKWYRHTNATLLDETTPPLEGADGALFDTPSQKGSGLTLGDGKFNFEKFRADPQEFGGYLQNHECVFNRDGIPDCFIDNLTGSANPVFFIDDVDYDEAEEGLPINKFKSKVVTGSYWTYATILSHIEKFWIKPYNANFAGLEFNSGDLSDVADIAENIARPMSFSIEGLNPISAIDLIVRSLPGNWIWYIDYQGAINRAKIRIKEIKSFFSTATMSLIVGKDCEQICDSIANVKSVKVTRNVNKAVKNIVAKGGKIKLLTTIKLVPLWPRFENEVPAINVNAPGEVFRTDFKDDADRSKWASFLTNFYKDNVAGVYEPDDVPKEDQLRYLQIYRNYGIIIDGNTFGERIVTGSDVSNDTDTLSGEEFADIQLTGDIADQYGSFTTDVKEMFYKNVRIEREIGAPQFNRYSDDIVVFMHDEKYDGLSSKNATERNSRAVRRKTPAGGSSLTDNEKNDFKWIIPDESDIGYEVDEKNGTVIFERPQFQRAIAESGNDTESIFQNLVLNEDMKSRDVYMTATFTSDVPAIISKKVDSPGAFVSPIIDFVGGPPFTEYITDNGQDIVVHDHAFYPTRFYDRDVETPIFKTETMDGHQIGFSIRKAQDFDNYKFYNSIGAVGLLRSIRSYLEGYGDFIEKVDVVLPFLEIGYSIGDKLKEIQNTPYVDLRSSLTGIVYSAVANSDHFETNYKLSNSYARERSNSSHVIPKGLEQDSSLNKRQVISYFNNNIESNLK